MKIADILQHLGGDVSGLRTMLIALMNSHPDPMAILGKVERLAELQIGITTGTAVSDEFLNGQDEAIAPFKRRLAEISRVEC